MMDELRISHFLSFRSEESAVRLHNVNAGCLAVLEMTN